MAKGGKKTRDKVLDAAQERIIRFGYAGTSIDHVIEAVGVTKGTFFYYFKSKADLAAALIERYATQDRALLQGTMGRAEQLSSDPLHQLLIFCALLAETLDQQDLENPGCLFASFAYESGHFEPPVLEIVKESTTLWRSRLSEKLRKVAASRPPKVEVDIEALADMLTVLVEGAYVMARSTHEPGLFGRQMTHYLNYLELLFSAKEAPQAPVPQPPAAV